MIMPDPSEINGKSIRGAARHSQDALAVKKFGFKTALKGPKKLRAKVASMTFVTCTCKTFLQICTN